VRRIVIAGVLVLAFAGAALAGVWVWQTREPAREPLVIKGTSTTEFEPETEPEEQAPRPRKTVMRIPWPTYGVDFARTRVAADLPHKPPYRRRWRIFTGANIEFPPAIGHGRLYVGNQGGLFVAVDGATGKRVWAQRIGLCAASSPTIDGKTVYQGFVREGRCRRGDRASARGLMVAFHADTGRIRWRFETGPIESTPALVRGALIFGTWSGEVHALDTKTRKLRWTAKLDDEVHAAPAVVDGTAYVSTIGGSIYALDVRTGRIRWSRSDGREHFYAGPTVAYGRVYVPNTDGTVFAYGARSGRLLWARTIGTYVYTSPAVAERRVYVGTYDGKFLALSAATGEPVWSFTASAAVHGAPVVMNGLVYLSTCPGCATSAAQRAVKSGERQTYALDLDTGQEVWRTPGVGGYSPIVADRRRVYLLGAAHVYALAPTKRRG
jgi:outer membrane protein assembly factor BamB